MKKYLIVFLLLGFNIKSFAVGQCGENCTVNTDCLGICKQCDTGPPGGACITCCDNPSENDCDLQPPCAWTPAGNPAGECRNISTWPCSAGVSEISKDTSKSTWIVLALFISVILPGLMIWRNQRQVAKK